MSYFKEVVHKHYTGFKLLCSYIIPLVLTILFVKQVYTDIATGYGGYAAGYLWGVGVIILIIVAVGSWRLSRKL